MNQASKPFNYSLRVSARSRHVRLSVKPYQGLEIVIPKRFPKKQIPRILQQHEAWIIKQLEKHHQTLQKIELPDNLLINLTSTNLLISYEPGAKASLDESDYALHIIYQTEQQAIKLLRKWIRSKAIDLLPPMLDQIACEFNFDYKKVGIRSQKSRWGSCSSAGTISLNDQLLFMPEETVRYLMIHELCHTRFMNHSENFWALVERCCANFKTHDRTLSNGREKVPNWFSASLYIS